MNKTIILLLIALFFYSCTRKGKVGECQIHVDMIDLDHASMVDSLTYSAYFHSPQIIPLETNSNCIIQKVHRIDIFKNKIYILDTKSSRLMAFDINGHYLNDIGRRGHGDGEYLEISDFSIDRENEVVYIWDELIGNAIKYDLISGKYINTIHHGNDGNQCYDMIFSNNKLYVNHTTKTKSQDNFMIKEIDLETGKISNVYLDANTYNKAWTLPLRNNNTGFFMRSTSIPKFAGMFSDTIMAITENGIIPAYCIKSEKLANKNDLGKIIDYYDKSGLYSFDTIEKEEKIFGIFNYLEFGNAIHFSFNKGGERFTLLYDKTSKQALKTKSFGDNFILNSGICYLDLIYCDGSQAVAILQTDAIPIFIDYAIHSNRLNSQINNYEALKAIAGKKDNNPILFIYKIK